jgi:hypothetical protein
MQGQADDLGGGVFKNGDLIAICHEKQSEI